MITRSWLFPDRSTVRHITGPRWPVSFPVDANLTKRQIIYKKKKESIISLPVCTFGSLPWITLNYIRRPKVMAPTLLQTYFIIHSCKKVSCWCWESVNWVQSIQSARLQVINCLQRGNSSKCIPAGQLWIGYLTGFILNQVFQVCNIKKSGFDLTRGVCYASQNSAAVSEWAQ